MKKGMVLILACLLAWPALARAEGAKQLGVYVGGHIGMSIENFSARKTNITDVDTGEKLSWSFGSDTDVTFGGGAAVGYDFSPKFNLPVRVEMDYTARTRGEANSSRRLMENLAGVDLRRKDKITLQTLMLNAWVDIPTGTQFTPYLGGGIGLGFINYKSNFDLDAFGNNIASGSGSTTETNFSWSLGGGVAYDCTENLTVDLGYRYIDAGKAKRNSHDFLSAGIDANTKVAVETHDIMLGLRYTF